MSPLQIRLQPDKIKRLNEIAKAEGTNRSDVCRIAIEKFIDDYTNDQFAEQESKLERRLARMEDSIRKLLVKDIRASAQCLFYLGLFFSKGIPKAALKQEALTNYWEQSRHFAVQYLRSKLDDTLPEAPADSSHND